MKNKHILLAINTLIVFFIFFLIPNINITNSSNMIMTADGPGDVWMNDPGDLEIGEEFTTNVYTNTGYEKCAAYGINILFDPTIVQVKLKEDDSVDVIASPDGFFAAGNVDNIIGDLMISGFDATGKGPSPELHLVIISWICIGEGDCPIDITAETLINADLTTIGTPEGVDSEFIVAESAAPEITSPSTISYEFGSSGNSISWNVIDASPKNYTIKRDGTPVDSGFYTSTAPISINIDGLSTNTYSYSLEVDDDVGNSNSDVVSVNVLPSIDPVLSDAPNIKFELGETGNTITWTATDSFPNTYTVKIGNSNVDSGEWTSGGPITYNVDHLLVGTYTIVIEVRDKAGNIVSDTVTVEVTAPPEGPNSVPGYDLFMMILVIGISIFGIGIYKRKKL
ncbi:MAG: hypothetical protein JXA99_13765 [Candidatus Lokiarchaeota archaeon]|nr:hypothetical protein [Candidatus Lokiarchaeota archaeon]